MRKREIYSVECVGCGRTIESETTELTCQHCGLLIRLEWGGKPAEPPPPTQPQRGKL